MIKRFLVSALAVAAVGAGAHAQTADNAIVNILDGAAPGSVTVAGITVYGSFDVGGVYQSHAERSIPGSFYASAEYAISKNAGASSWDKQNNALSTSTLGIKGTQSLRDLSGLDSLKGWSIGFDLQSGFDPLYGAVADVCKTISRNNGLTAGAAILTQTALADGSRCGQIFNGEAYGSLKNDVLGELRFGRQNTLLLTSLAAYDPTPGSYAFSLFGYFGGFGGGGGNTEDARWNNSLKYTNTIGPVRVGAMYRFDGGGQGGDAWSVGAGVDATGPLKGLSIDGVYAKFNAGIGASQLSSGNCTSAGFSSIAACENSTVLNGTIADTEAWAIMGKYAFGNATIMGGYQHIAWNNPSETLTNLNTIGGYTLFAAGLNTTQYQTERDNDIYWIGGKYAFTPKLIGTAAYYRLDQNSWIAKAGACNNLKGVAASPNCAGSMNFYSITADYQATKRMDLYAGVSWSDVSDGLASGFANTNIFNFAFGTRFRF